MEQVSADRLSAPRAMKRILLMDDSAVFLEVTAGALRAEGYDVACASDLAQLKELRERSTSDLVLMDVQMPEAFGDDIALTLRHVYDVHAPIYLLSSLDDAELAARVRWAQIDGFISKNGGLEHLLREVRRIFAANPEA
jgi:two-component system OmpR family response regulator